MASSQTDDPSMASAVELQPASVSKLLTTAAAWFQLTKPTIMLLVLVTGATALVLEGSLLEEPVRFGLVLLGLYLTGGAANALNQYLERDVDERMSRTKYQRPLPLGTISPGSALTFALTIATAGVLMFAVVFNLLTALLATATILFYSLIYTLWLKPTTSQNIVLGGAAGAMAPVGAWAAATGTLAITPWAIFLIVFVWTPPHFWSLALLCKDDYRSVGYPMLPVLKGDRATTAQIFWYSLALVASSLTPLFVGSGPLYAAAAGLLGAEFLRRAVRVRRSGNRDAVKSLFLYSITYLFTLCLALVIDHLLG